MNEEKTYVEDVDRSIYDFKDDEKDAFKLSAGLTPSIVEQISREKHDPRVDAAFPPAIAANLSEHARAGLGPFQSKG